LGGKRCTTLLDGIVKVQLLKKKIRKPSFVMSVFSSTLVSLKHVHYLVLPGHDISLRDEELGLLVDELFVEHLEQITGDLLADDNLDVVLLSGPEMLDELSFTSRLALGETVGLSAREILDVLGVIVADVGTEATLVGRLSGAVLSEIDTVGVLATLVGAVLPLLEDLKGLLVVLENDETSVEVDLVELVHVVLVGRVVGKCQRVGVGVELPVVHEPLKRQVEVVEDSIRVKEDASLVLLEDLGQNRGLLPRVAAVLKGIGDVNVVVLVTVVLGCERLENRN
jgi:hypothetical protein